MTSPAGTLGWMSAFVIMCQGRERTYNLVTLAFKGYPLSVLCPRFNLELDSLFILDNFIALALLTPGISL
jgi:hypothetical protein